MCLKCSGLSTKPMPPSEIEHLFDYPPAQYAEHHRRRFDSFKGALNRVEVRAAEPEAASRHRMAHYEQY